MFSPLNRSALREEAEGLRLGSRLVEALALRAPFEVVAGVAAVGVEFGQEPDAVGVDPVDGEEAREDRFPLRDELFDVAGRDLVVAVLGRQLVEVVDALLGRDFRRHHVVFGPGEMVPLLARDALVQDFEIRAGEDAFAEPGFFRSVFEMAVRSFRLRRR